MTRPLALALALGAVLTLAAPLPASGAQPPGTSNRWAERVVYIEDHTPRWPVAAAVKEWNAAGSGIRLVRVAECYRRTPCVQVRGRWAADYSYAATTYVTATQGRIIDAGVTVNRRYNPWPWVTRKGTIVHELGHVLGLRHDTRSTSVMYPTLYTTRVTAYDAGLLRRLYP